MQKCTISLSLAAPIELAAAARFSRLGATAAGVIVGFAIAIAIACGAGCAALPSGRQAVDRVDLEGTSAVSKAQIEAKLATAPSPRFLGLWNGFVFDYELFDRYVFERDLARVERFYRARGFYEAHARAGRVIRTKDNHVAVTIVVEEGPPVTVGEVQMDGLTQVPIDVASAALVTIRDKLRHGRPFDEDDFAAAESAVARTLADNGYAYGHVTTKANVDLNRHVADITMTLVPGPTAVIGAVTIEGLEGLPEGPVRRALDLTPGEPYAASALESAQRAALDLGVFSSVEVEPSLSDESARAVPVRVRVVPTKLHAVRLGGGLELDVIRTDFHVLTGWEDRNFLGGLRRISIDFKPGVALYPTRLPTLNPPQHLLPEQKVRIELRQPGFIEPRTGGFLRSEFNVLPFIVDSETQTSIPGFLELKGAAGADRKLWKAYASLSYNVQLESPFDYTGDASFPHVIVSYLDLLTNLDFRDSALRPHRGVFLGNELQLAGGPLGGNARDVRVQPEVRAYVPISRTVTFALRATTGFVFPQGYDAGLTSDPTRVLLVYFRGFFSGGPNSNRGYALHDIGLHGPIPSLNPNHPEYTYPLGGLTLWEASAELRLPILGPLTWAVFCDSSDVATERVKIRLDHPHPSAGAGLRYDTPVGPIRLDVGYRLQDDPQETPRTIFGSAPMAINIGIGEAF